MKIRYTETADVRQVETTGGTRWCRNLVAREVDVPVAEIPARCRALTEAHAGDRGFRLLDGDVADAVRKATAEREVNAAYGKAEGERRRRGRRPKARPDVPVKAGPVRSFWKP